MRIRTCIAGAAAVAGITVLGTGIGTAAPAGAQPVRATAAHSVSAVPQGCGYWDDDCGGWYDEGGWSDSYGGWSNSYSWYHGGG